MRRSAEGLHALAKAARHEHDCQLCEHRCGVNRRAGERGICRAGLTAHVFRHRVEYGEELELIPSHLFYLSGCDLRCSFCIAEANAFDPNRGQPLTGLFLREAISWGRDRGAKNLQWVGGEPTIHLPAIMAAMAECDEAPPIVWKSDFYGTPAVFELLFEFVDTYVADFKFGNNDCAQRIASVENYVETVTRNLRTAAAQGDLIVRHLVLPGHFECCYRPVVLWLREHLPRVKFSLRTSYLPRWRAHHDPQLRAMLDPQSADRATQYARQSGLRMVS